MLELSYTELFFVMAVPALIGFGFALLYFKAKKKDVEAISEAVAAPTQGLEKKLAETRSKLSIAEEKADRLGRELTAAQFTIRSMEQKAEKQEGSPPNTGDN